VGFSPGYAQGFLLQLLPAVLGSLWFAVYWLSRKRSGVCVTACPSAYRVPPYFPFAWIFEQILLVVSIIALACGYFFRLADRPGRWCGFPAR